MPVTAERAAETESLGRLLDLMRIVSALLIFYYHSGLFLQLPLSRFGDYAVSTFIALAVVASMSLGKRSGEVGFWEYLSRRVRRIFPAYALVNLLIFGASYFAPSRLGRPYSVGQLLLSTFGLSQYVGQPYLSEVFWFIPFIVQVYIIIALFGRRLLTLNWPIFFLVGVCVSAVAIFALNHVMVENLTEMRKWSPLLRLPEVGFGLMTAAILNRLLSTKQYFANVVIYAGFVGLLACASFAAPRATYLFFYPLFGLIITALVAAISLCSSILANVVGLSTGFLRFLGRATFPFFLIHGAGLRSLHRKFDGEWLAWAGYLLGCVIFAVAVEFLFTALSRRRSPAPGDSAQK